MRKKPLWITTAIGAALGLAFGFAVKTGGSPSYEARLPDCVVPRSQVPASMPGALTEGVFARGGYAKALDEVVAQAEKDGTPTAKLSSVALYQSGTFAVDFVTVSEVISYYWSPTGVSSGTPRARSEYTGEFPVTSFRALNAGAMIAHAQQLCTMKDGRLSIEGKPDADPEIEVWGMSDGSYATVSYDSTFTSIPTWWYRSSDLGAELTPMLKRLAEVGSLSISDTSIYVYGTSQDGDRLYVSRSGNDPVSVSTYQTGTTLSVAPDEIDPQVIAWLVERAIVELGEQPRSINVSLSSGADDALEYSVLLGGSDGYTSCEAKLDGSDFTC